MAPSPLSTIALLLSIYTAYRVITTFLACRRFRTFAKQHGCEEPRDASGPWPYGWRTMWRLMHLRSSGEDVLDDIVLQDFGDRHTIKKTGIDGISMIQTCDPANMQAMFANQFSDFETGPIRRAIFHPLLGNSIFSSDGPTWKHSRALLRPAFSRENVNNLSATALAADALIRSLLLGGPEPGAESDSDSAGWTEAQDVLPLFFCFTMDTATEFLFGRSVGSLGAVERERERAKMKMGGRGRGSGDAEVSTTAAAAAAAGEGREDQDHGAVAASSEFSDALRVANDGIVTRLRVGRFYWLADGVEFRRSIRTVTRFVDGFVEKALARVGAEGKAVQGKEKYGLLETLAAQTDNREDLVSQSLAVMMAGRDTTAALLGWCLLRLALHPDIFASLRATCLRDFASEENTQPDFAQLKSCRPLQNFLQEVLRLHATVPVNDRHCVKDTTLPLGGGADQQSPIPVREGQIVVFSVYMMHRRKDLWGEDALEFKPSRWEQKIPAWQWLPFLGGPRVCLGQQFALTEAGFLLVRLLREFDGVRAVDEEEMWRMRKGLGLTMWPGDGVKVRFHKAAT